MQVLAFWLLGAQAAPKVYLECVTAAPHSPEDNIPDHAVARGSAQDCIIRNVVGSRLTAGLRVTRVRRLSAYTHASFGYESVLCR